MAIFYVCGVCVTTSVNSMFSSNTMYNNNSLINLHHILLNLRCFINLNFFFLYIFRSSRRIRMVFYINYSISHISYFRRYYYDRCTSVEVNTIFFRKYDKYLKVNFEVFLRCSKSLCINIVYIKVNSMSDDI